jgi:hypothetical protein
MYLGRGIAEHVVEELQQRRAPGGVAQRTAHRRGGVGEEGRIEVAALQHPESGRQVRDVTEDVSTAHRPVTASIACRACGTMERPFPSQLMAPGISRAPLASTPACCASE